MDFLKKLFGGGGSGARDVGDPNGMYFFVQPDGCDEVIRVRIDRNNDLSLSDDNVTYWVRKEARGVKCRQPVEMTLYFDANRHLQTSELDGGKLVTREDYEAWVNQSGVS